jgi:hypothetical protein
VVQRHRGATRAGRHHPHLLIVVARRADVLEVARADKEVVAVRQVMHAKESGVTEVAGEQSSQPRLQVDLERVTEALRHEGDATAVRGPDGALAEAGEACDPSGELILRISRRASLRRECVRQCDDECGEKP